MDIGSFALHIRSMMNWEDLRFFLETKRAGSLSKAGQTLGVNATTVSRRITALEDELNVRLFNRTVPKWTLTPAGDRVANASGQMPASADAVTRAAFAESQEVRGELRITAGGEFLRRILAPIVWAFCDLNPEVSVRLVSAATALKLDRREADIAFRITDTPPDDAISRKIADLRFAVYGHKDLIDSGAVREAPVIICTNMASPDPSWADRVAPAARIVHQVSDEGLMLDAVRHGAGVALLPCRLGEEDQLLHRVTTSQRSSSARLWMIYHTDARRNRRLRAFRTYAAEALAAQKHQLEYGSA